MHRPLQLLPKPFQGQSAVTVLASLLPRRGPDARGLVGEPNTAVRRVLVLSSRSAGDATRTLRM